MFSSYDGDGSYNSIPVDNVDSQISHRECKGISRLVLGAFAWFIVLWVKMK